MIFWNNRKTGEKDVTLKVLYCGICHSDLHLFLGMISTFFLTMFVSFTLLLLLIIY